ncbi:MAG: ATP-dependent RecD-like DNA helicase [Ruminococcus sp.]|nr:ATP-dependent RecD-like DNA helicase [Ruminococcus sp.]
MENNELLEIESAVETIIYRNESNGYTVIELDDDDNTTAVGIMPDVYAGDSVRLIGSFRPHSTYGMQFSVTAYEKSMPDDIAGILKYLSSGSVKGIGPSTASRLVEQFGANTLEVLENEPQRVAKIKGISLKKATEISKQLRESVDLRELLMYLLKYDISPSNVVRIYKSFGSHSIEEIKNNPYALSDGDFGISFEKADNIAMQLGREYDDRLRVRAGIAYVLNHNKGLGHTCLPEDKLIETTAAFLRVSTEQTQSALDELCDDKSLIRYSADNRDYIFDAAMFNCEGYISARIKMMLRFPAAQIEDIDENVKAIEDYNHIKYASLQRKAITEALSKGLLILTGGPGTGKTTTLNAIIKILKNKGQKVLLCAPTGRAAQRMSDVTGEEAKTIHRLLEVAWNKDDLPEFRHNERNTLKCDALIIDEVSMVDAQLFESVMRALPLGCRLILVGDSNQLPSVGAGNVLDDLITTDIVPVVQLNEIFRQSMESLIVTNAHKIVNGEMPELGVRNKDFFFLSSDNKNIIEKTVISLASTRLPNAYGYDTLRDIQVLAPGRKSELGVTELNTALQEVINPADPEKNEITVGKRVLREGDKVMQTKNNYDLLWVKDNDETGEGVFNGEIGVIESINKRSRTIKIRYDDRVASYDFDFANDLDHAYATTVHKSQGNEFEAVIMPLYRGSPMLMYRNLLYTAVTRAKKLMIIVGSQEIIRKMINNNHKNKRYSGLKYFISEPDDE